MKKGMEYQGVVEKIDFPNKGTVDCGKEGVALVKRTIPGQKVSFVVSKKRSGKCVGRLKEVLEKSPLENAEPLCPHFADCGGCSYQTMDYENQTNLKKEMVKNILDGVITNKDYEFEDNIISLGILTTKDNEKADVLAKYIYNSEIKVI